MLGCEDSTLDVADVVEDEEVEDVEPAECSWQGEVALGGEQVLDDLVRRGEENRVSAVNEGVPDGGSGVALADTGEPEHQDVGGSVEEVAAAELLHLLHERLGKALLEGVEGLARRELRRLSKPLDASGRECQPNCVTGSSRRTRFIDATPESCL